MSRPGPVLPDLVLAVRGGALPHRLECLGAQLGGPGVLADLPTLGGAFACEVVPPDGAPVDRDPIDTNCPESSAMSLGISDLCGLMGMLTSRNGCQEKVIEPPGIRR